MPALMEYEVTVSHTASENATLKVMATSQEAAEAKVNNLLDQSHRVTLDELSKSRSPRIKVTEITCDGDEESSWEVI